MFFSVGKITVLIDSALNGIIIYSNNPVSTPIEIEYHIAGHRAEIKKVPDFAGK